jgi:hypothetical protein
VRSERASPGEWRDKNDVARWYIVYTHTHTHTHTASVYIVYTPVGGGVYKCLYMDEKGGKKEEPTRSVKNYQRCWRSGGWAGGHASFFWVREREKKMTCVNRAALFFSILPPSHSSSLFFGGGPQWENGWGGGAVGGGQCK